MSTTRPLRSAGQIAAIGGASLCLVAGGLTLLLLRSLDQALALALSDLHVDDDLG